MARRTITTITSTALALTMLVTGGVAQADDSAGAGDAAKLARLKDGVAQFHGVPGPEGDMYRFRTTVTRWSVVAIDPASDTDLELRLYGDKGEDELLGTSFLSTGVADFIAIDSAHRALDTYFPRVDTVVGDGIYDVQLAQSAQVLLDGPQVAPMLDGEIVDVRDTLLFAGKTYRFTVFPGSGLMAADVLLMDSPGSPADSVRSRSEAVDQAKGVLGKPVTFDYTAPRTDTYGLVIMRQGVSGTYHVLRQTF